MLESQISTAITPPPRSAHLFVLVHGLWGGASHLKSVEDLLIATLDNDKDLTKDRIKVIRPKTSALLKTYDGIEIISQRMLIEVLEYITDIQSPSSEEYGATVQALRVKRISFVGYSLGGLVARHLVGQFEKLGLFDYIEPVFYTSFASPHVGTWFFNRPWMNEVGSRIVGLVGAELFIKDKTKLLVEMTKGDYLKGLAKFKRRMCFANVRHDRSVSFSTSFITEFSPFEAAWHDIKLKYEDESIITPFKVSGRQAKSAILDLNATRYKTPEEIKASRSFSIVKTLKFCGIVVILCMLLPWWVPLVFTVSVSGTVIRHAFVRFWYRGPSEEELKAIIDGLTTEVDSLLIGENGFVSKLTDKLEDKKNSFIREDDKDLVRSIRELMEETTENIIESTVNVEQYTIRESTPCDDFDDSSVSFLSKSKKSKNLNRDDLQEGPVIETPITITAIEDNSSNLHANIHKFINPDLSRSPLVISTAPSSASSTSTSTSTSTSSKPSTSHLPKLPLDPSRKEILSNLNSLEWLKFAVNLNVLNAHNSIIVRRGLQKGNESGIALLANWCGLLKEELRSLQDHVV